MDEPKLRTALDELVHAELAFCRGTPPDAIYTFKHALVRDAAYESLLKSRRQQLHCRIATILRERFPDRAEAEPEVLAHHATEGGLLDDAVIVLAQGGPARQLSLGQRRSHCAPLQGPGSSRATSQRARPATIARSTCSLRLAFHWLPPRAMGQPRPWPPTRGHCELVQQTGQRDVPILPRAAWPVDRPSRPGTDAHGA